MTAGNNAKRDEGYPMTLHLRLQRPKNAIENRRRVGTDLSPCVVAQEGTKAQVVGYCKAVIPSFHHSSPTVSFLFIYQQANETFLRCERIRIMMCSEHD